jgi:CRP/FNR family transcriptional regulator, cyclic AMP receptor protein
MEKESLSAVIARPVFQGLPAAHARALASAAAPARFDAGEWILRAGDPADVFYVVHDGEVEVQLFVPDRGLATIETLGAASVLGWSWLFPPYRTHFEARARSAVRALSFDGVALRLKCEDDPAFGFEMMKRFAPILIARLETLGGTRVP